MSRIARTARKPQLPKPPGRLRRYLRRRARAVLPCAAWLAPFAAASVVLQAWWPLVFVLGGITALAGDRLRLHWGWHRRGGRAALRKRRQFQGEASLAEIGRSLGRGQGVLIGTARRGS